MALDGVLPTLHSNARGTTTTTHSTADDRRTGHEALELLTGWAMLEAALWTSGREQVVIGIAALAVMVAMNFTSGYASFDQGLSLRANRRALWLIPCALIISALILAIGFLTGTVHLHNSTHTLAWRSLAYVAWAFVQEWMALGFVFVRLERLTPAPYPVVGCATIFSVAHLPNIPLMVVTLAMSLCFALLFRRYRALFPLACAHAAFGLSVAVAMPAWLTHSMRVGVAYFR